MDLLEELIAERDILKTLSRYVHYTDDMNPEAWVNMFTPDGVMVVGPKRMQGHAELLAWIRQVHSGPKLRHLMTNAVVTVATPTTATMAVDMALLRAEGVKWVLSAAPRYRDKLVRTDDGWKFSERVIELRAP
jgi:hypothetical protein